MVVKKTRAAALTIALYCGAALASSAEAAEVQVINRLGVACTVEAPDLSISVDAQSTTAATIDDAVGDQLKAVCTGSGLDKDVAECKLLIGGTGGSGDAKDEAFEFKYVKEIHVFAQIGQWLVCSSI
jgi:hypothetical protein